MGPRVPFVSNPFGAISPNKVVETETETETTSWELVSSTAYYVPYFSICLPTCENFNCSASKRAGPFLRNKVNIVGAVPNFSCYLQFEDKFMVFVSELFSSCFCFSLFADSFFHCSYDHIKASLDQILYNVVLSNISVDHFNSLPNVDASPCKPVYVLTFKHLFNLCFKCLATMKNLYVLYVGLEVKFEPQITILTSHDHLPSGLVAQLVEQR